MTGALADAVAVELAKLLKGSRRVAFQQSLLEGPRRARLDELTRFRFDPQVYPARWFYPATARYRFRKRFSPPPARRGRKRWAEAHPTCLGM